MSEREMLINIHILRSLKAVADLIDEKYLAEMEEKLLGRLVVEIQKPSVEDRAKNCGVALQ